MRVDRARSIRTLRSLSAIGLIIAAALFVRAERLPLKIYTTADGLGHNSVGRIVRDSRGFLWFCTLEGLSRFDGYGFTTYGIDQGLPSPVVNDLLETREGQYWVATAAGLCRFNPRGIAQLHSPSGAQQSVSSNPMFVVHSPGEEAESKNVRALLEDHTGAVWCGTARGLYRLEEQNGQTGFRFIEFGAAIRVTSIIEDRHGTLWIGTRDDGLYRLFPDGRVERYDKRQGLPHPHIHSLLEDREGRIWVGTRLGGLLRLVSDPDPTRPVVARRYTTGDGLPAIWINRIFQASNGSLWAGSNHGLIRFVPTGSDFRFRVYTMAHGLSFREVESVAEDRNHNLWLGMVAFGGAVKLARNGFTAYAEADGFRAPNAIFKDKAGDLCVKNNTGLGYEVIKRFDGERFTETQLRIPKDIGYSWGWNQVVLEDRAGEWWVATYGGIYRFPRVNRFEQLARMPPKAIYTMRDGLAGNTILRLFEDSRGDIWISSVQGGGVSRWERATETFHHYTERDGLPSFTTSRLYPMSFCEDHTGGVWIGFSFGGGLALYRDGQFTRFASSDGLAEGSIFNLFIDSQGRLWVPTAGGGVCRVDSPETTGPAIHTYTTANGLSSNDVRAVTEDRWGRLYFTTERGIDRLDTATGHIKHYTAADGVPLSASQAALQDRDGALWFSFAFGLVRLVPEADQPPLSAPVLITGLRIAGNLQPISALGETEVAPVELGADKNQLQVDFVALGFSPGEGLRYQHKLEGTNQDWSPLSELRTVNFASLSPGRYRFLVRAVNADGVMSESPASFAFTILSPVWQRWWFIALGAGLLGLVVYSMFRYRLARLLELERVRTRIAADLHDDIGAGLSRMAILSEVVKRLPEGAGSGKATPMLTEIGDSARGLLESMREIVWAIDPRRDGLDNLASQIREFASDLLDAQGIKWEFRVPEEINRIKLAPEQRRQLLLIFKEALHNIERHSGCGNVHLSVALSHRRLTAEIRDDGRGFVPPPIQSLSANGQGNGLENMRRRASQLGGHLDIRSAPGEGTCLDLTIPLKRR